MNYHISMIDYTYFLNMIYDQKQMIMIQKHNQTLQDLGDIYLKKTPGLGSPESKYYICLTKHLPPDCIVACENRRHLFCYISPVLTDLLFGLDVP